MILPRLGLPSRAKGRIALGRLEQQHGGAQGNH